MEPEGSLSH